MKKMLSRTTVYLILIVILAAILRILRMLEDDRFSVDAYLYFQMAENWAYYGIDYVSMYDVKNIPLLLPWTMAIGYNLGLGPEHTGLIIGILLGSIMPLSTFWIALNLFSVEKKNEVISPETAVTENTLPTSHVYALLAAFLVAIHPFLARISVSCLRETLYLPLITLAVAFAVSAIYNESLWKWFMFAVLMAFANMARREGISLIFIFFVWLAVEVIADRKKFINDIKYYITVSVIVAFTFSVLTFIALYMLPSSSYMWNPFYINFSI